MGIDHGLLDSLLLGKQIFCSIGPLFSKDTRYLWENLLFNYVIKLFQWCNEIVSVEILGGKT
jgi:hypothetical protein